MRIYFRASLLIAVTLVLGLVVETSNAQPGNRSRDGADEQGQRDGARNRQGQGQRGQGQRGQGQRGQGQRGQGQRGPGERGQALRGQGQQGQNPGAAIFALFDRDRDGQISVEEIDNAAGLLKKLDRDGDGNISRQELQQAMSVMRDRADNRPEGDGRPRDGQPRDGRPRDGQARDGQPPRDGQPRDGQPRDGQPRDGRPRDGRPRDGQAREGEALDPDRMVEAMFRRLDKNQDGKLTGDEIPEQMARAIDRSDTNGDNSLSKAEVKAALEARGRRGGQDGPRGQRDRDGQADPNAGGVKPRRPGGDGG